MDKKPRRSAHHFNTCRVTARPRSPLVSRVTSVRAARPVVVPVDLSAIARAWPPVEDRVPGRVLSLEAGIGETLAGGRLYGLVVPRGEAGAAFATSLAYNLARGEGVGAAGRRQVVRVAVALRDEPPSAFVARIATLEGIRREDLDGDDVAVAGAAREWLAERLEATPGLLVFAPGAPSSAISEVVSERWCGGPAVLLWIGGALHPGVLRSLRDAALRFGVAVLVVAEDAPGSYLRHLRAAGANMFVANAGGSSCVRASLGKRCGTPALVRSRMQCAGGIRSRVAPDELAELEARPHVDREGK